MRSFLIIAFSFLNAHFFQDGGCPRRRGRWSLHHVPKTTEDMKLRKRCSCRIASIILYAYCDFNREQKNGMNKRLSLADVTCRSRERESRVRVWDREHLRTSIEVDNVGIDILVLCSDRRCLSRICALGPKESSVLSFSPVRVSEEITRELGQRV